MRMSYFPQLRNNQPSYTKPIEFEVQIKTDKRI